MALLIEERVLVTDKDLLSELYQKGYGEKDKKSLLLSPEETLYLTEKRKDFPVTNKAGKELDFDKLFKHFTKKDKLFALKYFVFRDLKDRGFLVKSGFKFGTHFRVYNRGEKPGKGHAVWLIQAVPEEFTVDWSVISRSIRLAQNVRKNMIYATVDKDGDVTYYKMERITP